jgi:hypothetical protein
MRRTPREKKELSYAKDCRSNYGNSDKAARKSVPRSKAWQRRANRRLAHQTLATHGEDRLGLIRPKTWWRKWPDLPLGDVIGDKRFKRTGPQPQSVAPTNTDAPLMRDIEGASVWPSKV